MRHGVGSLVLAAGLAAAGHGQAQSDNGGGMDLSVPRTYETIPSLGESKKAVGRLFRCGWAYVGESRAWGCWFPTIPEAQVSFDNSAFELSLARDVAAEDRGNADAGVRAISANVSQVPRRAVLRFGRTFGFTARQVREVLIHRTRIVNQNRLHMTRGGGKLEIKKLAHR